MIQSDKDLEKQFSAFNRDLSSIDDYLQKQEIIKRINHTADPGQIALIVMEFLQLGLDFLDKFPPP